MSISYDKNDCFLLFSCCIPIRGITKSMIYDIQRIKYIEIDNLLFDVLERNKGKTIFELKESYNGEFNKGIDKYISYFIENQLGFLTKEPERFPPIENVWDSPHVLNNAVVEYSKDSSFDLFDVLTQLDKIGCPFLQLKFVDKVDLRDIKKILAFSNKSNFKGVQVFYPYRKDKSEPYWKNFLFPYYNVANFYLFDTPKDRLDNYEKESTSYRVKYISDYERLTPELFFNFSTFFEANSFNVALNRKVSVDKKGFVKNYLTHKKDYGNIKKISIADVIKKKDFRQYWETSNNEIEICKDCQYRYMCVSTSDLYKKDGKLYKKDMCEFNPYKNEWKNTE